MITATRTILGIAALACAGALSMIQPMANPNPRLPAPVAITSASGKAIDRLPAAQAARPTGEEVMARIRAAHGLDRPAPMVADLDCKAFAWPNIPVACLTAADGAQERRAVRVIGAEARPVIAPTIAPAAATSAPRAAEPRTVRN